MSQTKKKTDSYRNDGMSNNKMGDIQCIHSYNHNLHTITQDSSNFLGFSVMLGLFMDAKHFLSRETPVAEVAFPFDAFVKFFDMPS